MRILALETNTAKLLKRLLSDGEQLIFCERKHWLVLFVILLRALVITAILGGLLSLAIWSGIPWLLGAQVAGLAWFFLVFLVFFRDFIDWRYDYFILTSEELMIVDQSSIFRLKIRQVNLDNVAGVSAETQLWNIFPFGQVSCQLKEGLGEPVHARYLPYAERLAAKISDAVIAVQRRRRESRPLHDEA